VRRFGDVARWINFSGFRFHLLIFTRSKEASVWTYDVRLHLAVGIGDDYMLEIKLLPSFGKCVSEVKDLS